MRKILSASVITAGLLVVPAAAQADSSLRSEASHLRAQVVHRFGATAPGRDIVRDGFWTGRRARRASRAELRGYVQTLRGMLAPPPVPARTTTVHSISTAGSTVSSTTTPVVAAVSTTGLARCIIQHESGGNPQAVSGQYAGIGQWSPTAWQQDGGTRYASSPTGASYAQQLAVLNGEGAAGMRQQQGVFDGCS